MAIFQFPNEIVVRDIDTAEELELAKFTDTGNLAHIGVYILCEDLTGNEEITLELRESDGTTVRGTSNTIKLSDLDGYSQYFLAWVRFEFNNENLGTDLRLFAKTTNYTYVEGSNSLSFLRNWVNPTYPTVDNTFLTRPCDIQIFKLEI